MRLLADFMVNKQYRGCVALLCLLYVITNTFDGLINSFDYIFVLYIIYLPRINEKTALGYALVFGLAYDLVYQFHLGVGVLFFQFLNVLKLHAYASIDMNAPYANWIYYLSAGTLYLIITLKLFGYSSGAFWYNLGVQIVINMTALFIITGIVGFIGGRYVASKS